MTQLQQMTADIYKADPAGNQLIAWRKITGKAYENIAYKC